MKIYTFWNTTASAPDDQAEWLRLWEANWSRAGWEPKLLTVLNSRRSKYYTPSENVFDQMFFALESVGGGWLATPQLFNAGLKPFRPKQKIVIEPWVLVWQAPQTPIQLAKANDMVRFDKKTVGACRLFRAISDVLESGICR